jgi:class 3 adenylate cyclase/tetratricopeptide (TPR) repeat protein
MKCPKCQHENPSDARFCNECGQKLELTCPQCGKVNPPGSGFCNGCGSSLTAPKKPESLSLSFDEKITKIQKYLPEGLTEKILSQRDRIEGEKRQVTVMFCDMEGYTSISEKLGPEAVYTLMDQVYEILIHKVNDFGGTVNELTGDGIMALFGAPIALEDAPQRAIRSAISIHKEITRFSERMSSENGIPPIRMRAGIHSGPVVIGTVGNNLRVDFKAIGDTVNLASRMESLAEPGATYVSDETFKLTEGLFRFENLGEREIKGKKVRVRVYRVLAPSSRRTRFDVSTERGLTSFVGRDRELELVLDAFERAKEGKGQVFSVIGEAGIGKSRFLYEFRKAVTNEDILFLEGKCLSYGKTVPYHPISDVLKGNFGINEDDTEELIRQKVSKSLGAMQADEATTLPYLLELLGVKDSGIDKMSMSPEGRREGIIEAVKQIIHKGARIRPLVVTIEDLHWADQSTENALKWIIETVPGARVLAVFTYRPEFVHTWGGRSYHNQITLNRLSNRESLLMVSNVLDSSDLDPELQSLILSKTEGVPFFIEEFVKSLRDLRVIRREDGKVLLDGDPHSIAIPSTIQDMTMARVDRLCDPAKTVLQTGSVIEREFSHELIRKVIDLPEAELLSHLSALKDAELLYERGVYPKASYIFRHALTREVVYASILGRKRKELHCQIAKAIEDLRKEDLAGEYEILAEHFFHGEDYAKAARYYQRAARKAEKGASLPDAITHAQKRVLCLDKLPDTLERGIELIDARTALGLYLTQVNHHTEARDAVEPIVRPAIEKGNRRRVCQIRFILGAYYVFVDEDFPKALEAFGEALRIATDEKDILTLTLVSFYLGWTHSHSGQFAEAKESFERALNINVAVNSLWGIAATKACLAYAVHYYKGEINPFWESSAEALSIAKESGDPYSRGVAEAVYGSACYAKGRLQDAENHSLKGRDLCERVGLYSWAGAACALLAETYVEMKEYEKCRECFQQGISFWNRVRFGPTWVLWAELGIGRCRSMLRDENIELESLRAASKKVKIKVAEGWSYRYLGETLLNLGGDHFAEAEFWMRKAIEADQRNGARFQLGLDHALYAEFFRRLKDSIKTQQELGKAIEILSECGAEGWVKKYETEMAKVT